MTVRDLLSGARARLTISETPYLDATVLLEWATGIDRATLLAEQRSLAESVCRADQITSFHSAVEQRSTGRPIAYIIGVKEFYGRVFQVGSGVLIPRPDTEVLVERVLSIIGHHQHDHVPLSIHDCCTGSGCIGISIVAELLERTTTPIALVLSDIDDTALTWARRNIESLLSHRTGRLKVATVQRDLLTSAEDADPETVPLNQRVDLIVANPPYLSDAETVTALSQGWGEPELALSAGEDGLDVIRSLVPQAFSYLRPGGYLIVEHGMHQGSAVGKLCSSAGFTDVLTGQDLAGRDRYTEARIRTQ